MAFSSLPLMRQRILIMLFVEELTPSEIARKMNCSGPCLTTSVLWAI